ncbi:MAG: ATP-binding protein [Armatimonadetes bacterium]|nr:ATP-binding protein [Armatimonadota bacterium]
MGAAALLAVLATTVTRWLDKKVSPLVEWLFVFLVFLAVVVALHTLMASVRARWMRWAADIIRGIAEGRAKIEMASLVDTAVQYWHKELQAAILELNESITRLRQRNRWSEAVVAHTANGVLEIDSEGRITLCNPAAEEMFGRKKSTLLGRKIEDCDLHPELAKLAYECLDSDVPLETEIKMPGQPLRVLTPRVVSIRGPRRKDDFAMMVIQDVSEVRRRQMHEREFVSNVSHEFRTPITAVRTTAEALISGAKNDPEVVDRFLNTIISESERLSALIDDLLEIAKRDYGIAKGQNEHITVSEIINRAVDVVRPLAWQKDVSVEVDVPEDLVEYCDESQMLQLVRNLADNAVKYTPEGGRVNISAHEEDSNLVISVKDTGIGIPHGEVGRIFERFYRVDKARSRRMGGTGLGLAIVKDIVDSYGGTIKVETELDVGSTFTVEMPVRMVNAESAPRTAEAEEE